jgi:hypothetical protein
METNVTSISSATFQQFSSPRDLLQSELSSEVSAGTISSADGSALGSALNDIDASLQQNRASGATSGGQPPSPGGIRQKIDDLIASEVKSGKLTDSQAKELKNVFAKAFQHAGPGAASGSDDSSTQSTSSSSADSSLPSTSSSGANQLLQDFIKLLQDAQSTSGYNATGDVQSQLKSLLVNYQT